ncbi:MAG: hypothetical protein ACKO4Q_09490, partial [Planctomycetota bacterium]
MLLDLEVFGHSGASRSTLLLCDGQRLRRHSRRRGARVERPLLISREDRRWRRLLLDRGIRGLALLALGDREQLCDAVVEPRDLGDQLRLRVEQGRVRRQDRGDLRTLLG